MSRLGKRLIFVLFAAAAVGSAGCRLRSAPPPATTPERAFEAFKQALVSSDAKALFGLVDQQTRWSVLSSLRAWRAARELVLAHYPPSRQQGELQRIGAEALAADPAEYLLSHGRRNLLWPKLRPADRPQRSSEGRGDGANEVTLVSGRHRLRFCREKARWAYCGLRDNLERLKLRASRDLATLRESVEASGEEDS